MIDAAEWHEHERKRPGKPLGRNAVTQSEARGDQPEGPARQQSTAKKALTKSEIKQAEPEDKEAGGDGTSTTTRITPHTLSAATNSYRRKGLVSRLPRLRAHLLDEGCGEADN